MTDENCPFPAQKARAFTKEEIEALNPDEFGCYGIFRTERRWMRLRTGRRWIYIGKGNIRGRLLDHLSGDRPCIQRCSATHFVILATADMDSAQERLVQELNPVCNRRRAGPGSLVSIEQTRVPRR